MDSFTVIGLVIGFTSLFLGLFAIWLSLYQKREADKVNEKTLDALSDIKTNANTISQIAMPELRAYGQSMRQFIFRQNGNDIYQTENLGEKIEEKVMDSMANINQKIEEISKSIEFANSNKENTIKLDKLLKQLENLKSYTDTSTLSIKKDIKNITDDITIDMSNINGKIFRITFGYFKTVSSLLNMLYSEYLRDFVPIWTYGQVWILKNKKTGEIIRKVNKNDERRLESAGICSGDTFEIVFLEQTDNLQ